MWNEKLNLEWESKLREYCSGKRVLIVGNALSLFSKPQGEFIDSFDVIVRMGKGYPHVPVREYLGSRTDVWMGSILRLSEHARFTDTPFKVINLSQIPLYENEKKGITISKDFFKNSLQVYKDYFLLGNMYMHHKLIRDAYGKVSKDMRASQGAITISYFVNLIKSQSELHLIGFDFFESKFTYKMDGELNEISSFHLPIPLLKGKNSLPHEDHERQISFDKVFVNKLMEQNKVIHHPMQVGELPKDVMDFIIQNYRPNVEPVYETANN